MTVDFTEDECIKLYGQVIEIEDGKTLSKKAFRLKKIKHVPNSLFALIPKIISVKKRSFMW